MLFLSDLMKRLNQWWRKSMVFFFALWLVPCIIASALTLTAATRRDSATTRDRACRAAAFTVSTATADALAWRRPDAAPRPHAAATRRVMLPPPPPPLRLRCCVGFSSTSEGAAATGTAAAILLLYDMLAHVGGVALSCRFSDPRRWLRRKWANCTAVTRSVFGTNYVVVAAPAARSAPVPVAAGARRGVRRGAQRGGAVSLEVVGPSLHQDLETLYTRSLEDRELQMALEISLTTHREETRHDNRSRGERRIRRYARAISRTVRAQAAHH